MRFSTVLVCLFSGLVLAFTGCAKPPVRSYPRPTVYDQSSRPQPQVPPSMEAGEDKQARQPEESGTTDERTEPFTSYDIPLAPIGTQPGVESSTGDDFLLAAVTPLAEQASRQLANGDPGSAQTTAERAVRIDPNNADLWHLMAKIQLARENFSQAEQLARKSNLLAKGNTNLQSRNWRIIAESLDRRNDATGAKDAMNKARRLESN